MWYIYKEVSRSHRKESNNVISTNMNATRDYHTKWSESGRERQISFDITYVWNLQYDSNVLFYETETVMDIEGTFVVAKGERFGGGME